MNQSRTPIVLAAALASLAAPLSAQGEPVSPRVASTSPAHAQPGTAGKLDLARVPLGVDHGRMHYDQPGDGALWARGASYKARFGADGVTYIPILGPRAPRNPEVAFRLESVACGGSPIALDPITAPSRTGDTVVYDRGGLVEEYEMSPAAIEQRFVFESLPARGDLVVRIAVESELGRAGTADALELAGDLVTVRYGRAVAIDARGEIAPADTRWSGPGIEITVPGSFVASARLPLTIDPIVTSGGIDTTSFDNFLPDVAYDATNNRYLVVYEEVASASDHDVYSVELNASAVVTTGGYIDTTIAYWANPRCANLNTADQFLVVAQVGDPTGSKVIWGRTVAAGTHVLGIPFTISATDDVTDRLNPDVGGDPYPIAPAYYCVVWEHAITTTNHDIHARLVRPDGTLSGASTTVIDGSLATLDEKPCVSKSDDGVEWYVVWQRQVAASNHDIRGAQIHWDGTVTTPSFALDSGSADTTNPVVSTPLDATLDTLLAYEVNLGTDHDVWVRRMDGTTSVDVDDLSSLESLAGSGAQARDQIRPSVDSDGVCFTVAYSEQVGTSATNYDAYVATITPVGSNLMLSEGHLQLSASLTREDHTQVASTKGSAGAVRRHLVVWDDAAGGVFQGNIEGGLYDCGQFTSFCFPGNDGVIPCPCGNPPAAIGRGCNNSAGTGGAILSAINGASVSSDILALHVVGELPTATSIFVQGNGILAAGIVFGQGVRCTGGTLKRLYVKTASGGAVTAPGGADPHITVISTFLGDPIAAGSMRWYYVYYRDPIVLGGCPATSAFNTTQGLQVIWAP